MKINIKKEFVVSAACGLGGIAAAAFCAAVGVNTFAWVFGVGIAAGAGARVGYQIASDDSEQSPN